MHSLLGASTYGMSCLFACIAAQLHDINADNTAKGTGHDPARIGTSRGLIRRGHGLEHLLSTSTSNVNYKTKNCHSFLLYYLVIMN